MFAGSGCVGIAVLKHVKNTTVVFADSQKNCVDQIKINLKINGVAKTNYRVIQSNLFETIFGKFDYILVNPPYIPTKRKHKIQKSVLAYEPKTALFGGEDGILYIEKFLAEAKNFLNPDAKVFMEFDSLQKKQIEKLLKKYEYKTWEFQKDQFNRWRYVIVK